ncbi:Protein of unknown function DUF262 [Nitrosospira multiformis]|uniref:GmrSD restriction endonucleases N-terminal domain-containing protein n=1 Tax=Nitrosospira multiformis TaxID=1231 RepID=A0A1H8EUU3_9PROT|nr:DUF262 domain-containing protein [Nitrosospira multiformis]SEN22518.1 Protein of unknown function DUF262 [Nitrosospira multiformis]
MAQGIEQSELSYSEEYEYREQPPPDIVVFNELRSCADLYRLYEKKQLDVDPYFQRGVVWDGPDQTRFIDSLIKQLPIPSMCFGFDYKKSKWMVIDGLQRMSSIIRFFDKTKNWKFSKLKDIDPRLAGADVRLFRDDTSELHVYYERVENLTLPITVLRCDFSELRHLDYLFKIFHRLNAGGMRLNNQEIRNCIYSGPFNILLIELDRSAEWQTFLSIVHGKKERFRSVELVLRFFAFYEDRESYKGNLPRFLNDFMATRRWTSDTLLLEMRLKFKKTLDVIVNKLIVLIDGKKFGFSQAEALLVAIASNISSVSNFTSEELQQRYQKFLNIPLLSTTALSADISRTDSVKQRIKQAIESFS